MMKFIVCFCSIVFSITGFSQPVISKPTTVSNPKIDQVKNAGLINEYQRAINNPALVKSFRWFFTINPMNYEIDPLTHVARTNRDTGIVNYSKKVSLSLVGWQPVVPNGTADDSLVHLKPLLRLEHIIIPGFTGDVGAGHLSSMGQLKTLRFSRTGLTNDKLTVAGINSIALLTHLEFLELPPCTKVKIGEYKNLRNLTGLKEIRMIEWTVPDSEFSFLAYLKSLRKVDLNRSGIGDQALGYLAGHPYLEELNLEFDSITNKSIAHLATMPSLKAIVINHTQMDLDAGYESFRNMLLNNPNLKHISMYGVKASNETITRLRTDCPGRSFFH